MFKVNIKVNNSMFKVSNRNTRTRCEICSKSTIKTPERRQWRRSGVFVNFEHISHFVLVFIKFDHVIAGWIVDIMYECIILNDSPTNFKF